MEQGPMGHAASLKRRPTWIMIALRPPVSLPRGTQNRNGFSDSPYKKAWRRASMDKPVLPRSICGDREGIGGVRIRHRVGPHVPLRLWAWVRGNKVAGSAGHKVACCGAVIRCLGECRLVRATVIVTHRREIEVIFEIVTSTIVAGKECRDVDSRNNISRVYASPMDGTRSMEGNSKQMSAQTSSDHPAIHY